MPTFKGKLKLCFLIKLVENMSLTLTTPPPDASPHPRQENKKHWIKASLLYILKEGHIGEGWVHSVQNNWPQKPANSSQNIIHM